jgi:tRNA(Ile)-lysidine synthase TilS/MesJ
MIEPHVTRYIQRHRLLAGLGDAPLLVAVSGGPDSLAL